MTDFLADTEEARIEFCLAFRISDEDWAKANIPWNVLVQIAEDHSVQFQSLTESASMYANIIQSIDGVHSVRWRVKDALHLVAKIVRKRAEEKVEYSKISASNYFETVTDLLGIRALHLFKGDFAGIHRALQPLFKDKEPPFANVRVGDPKEFSDACEEMGLVVKEHPAGYRSIHYVKTVRPINRDLSIEIQVRTVFEEGWSEVDHRIRYPNFSSNPLVAYASMILNRLSGMADEMSSYSMQLANSLSSQAEEISKSRLERDVALKRMDVLVQEIENVKDGAATKEATISNLKDELAKIRSAANKEVDPNLLLRFGGQLPASIFSINQDDGGVLKSLGGLRPNSGSSAANLLAEFARRDEEKE